MLGGYRLCAEIGKGGMATVFLARGSSRAGLHRFVALKCIRPELAADPQMLEMFLDEGAIAAHVHHANVCHVFDFDEQHGTYYIVMEFLSGQTLTAVQGQLATAPDPRERRPAIHARILESACEGLHAAHEAVGSTGAPLHIVHRDVSPDNLFVTYDGNVKVMDFGVAYAAEHHHATRTGYVKGKCRYLAPEVIAGSKPDRRADIWGLGVVAWELLTEQRLFGQSNDLAILRAIAEVPIPPPSTVRPELPRALDDIVLHALERDPANRYHTARELGRAFNRFIVEHQQVIGIAEIADFMWTLFPDGTAWTRDLLQVAELAGPPPRAKRTTSKPRTSAASAVIAHSETEQRTLSEATRVEPPPRADLKPLGTPGQPAPSARLRSRWSRPSAWMAIAVIVAATLLLAFRHPSGGDQPRSELSIPNEPGLADYTLQITPAGIEPSGATLLRVQLVPAP